MKRTQTRLFSRILAFILALLMLGSCLPSVFATEAGSEPVADSESGVFSIFVTIAALKEITRMPFS